MLDLPTDQLVVEVMMMADERSVFSPKGYEPTQSQMM